MRRAEGTHPIYWRTLQYEPPQDWVLTPIEKMADIVKGKLPNSLSSQPNDKTVPYLLIDGLTNGHSLYTEDVSLPMINERDTVVVADGSRSGLPIRGVSGALGSTLLRYRAKDDFDPDFLFYLLESLYPYTNTATIGGAVPHLDKRLLARLEIYVPSHDERQLIGKLLSVTDRAISSANTEILSARRLKTALMQQLFIKGIPGKHTKFKLTKIGEIPEEWDIVRLGDILTSVQYGLSEGFGERGQFQILRMMNIENGYVHNRAPVYIELDKKTYDAYHLEVGDILFNRTNSLELVGRVGIVREPLEAVFASYLVRLKTNREMVDPFFLNFYLNSYKVQCRYRRFATPAVGQANINPTNLKKTLIAIPSRKKSTEQDEIVSLLRECDTTIEGLSDEFSRLEWLKKSLLQNLLTGKVRIQSEGI